MRDAVTPERWLPISGFEGLYEVSNFGQVRSLDRVVPNRHGQGERRLKGQLKPLTRTTSQPYVRVFLCRDNTTRTYRVHRLVAQAFLGPCPEGMEVRHLNGDGADNRVSNLCYGTSQQNKGDTVAHGHHWLKSKANCVRGHRLEAPNLVETQLPYRNCLACQRGRNFTVQAARRGITLDRQEESDRHYEAIMAGRGDELLRRGSDLCPRGHRYDSSYVVKKTGAVVKSCKTCNREKMRRVRAARKA